MADLERVFLIIVFLSVMIAALLSFFRRRFRGNQSRSVDDDASREEPNPLGFQKPPVKGPNDQLAPKTVELVNSPLNPPSGSGKQLGVGNGEIATLIRYQAKQFIGSAGSTASNDAIRDSRKTVIISPRRKRTHSLAETLSNDDQRKQTPSQHKRLRPDVAERSPANHAAYIVSPPQPVSDDPRTQEVVRLIQSSTPQTIACQQPSKEADIDPPSTVRLSEHDSRVLRFFGDRTDSCSEMEVVNTCKKLNADIAALAIDLLYISDEIQATGNDEQLKRRHPTKGIPVGTDELHSAIGKRLHDMIVESTPSDLDFEGHLQDAVQAWIVFNVCHAVNSVSFNARFPGRDEASRYFADIQAEVEEHEGMNAGLWEDLKSVHASEEENLDLIFTRMLHQGEREPFVLHWRAIAYQYAKVHPCHEAASKQFRDKIVKGLLTIFALAGKTPSTTSFEDKVRSLVSKGRIVETAVQLSNLVMSHIFSTGIEVFFIEPGSEYDATEANSGQQSSKSTRRGRTSSILQILCTVSVGMRERSSGNFMKRRILLKPEVIIP